MAQPKLSVAVTWRQLREEVIYVFRAALVSLAREPQVPRKETDINLRLLKLAMAAHSARLRTGAGTLPFNIMFNSTNQPLPGEESDDPRLFKMPDFDCVMKDAQNPEPLLSQQHYYLECKRLGLRENNWALNANYAAHGVNRFVDAAWGYGKGCDSGTMIGYLQNMEPVAVVAEVNAGIGTHGLPPLRMDADWVDRGVNELAQEDLTRTVIPVRFALGHLWVDLRHCTQSALPAEPVIVAPPRSGRTRRGTPKKTTNATRTRKK